jgi:TRAP-type C4-dicarboxylate transport system permease small subunit
VSDATEKRSGRPSRDGRLFPWRIADAILELPGWVAALLQLACTLMLAVGVASRYINGSNIGTYTNEFALVIACWVAFLGAAEGIRANYHVTINLLVVRFPPRLQAISDFVIGVVMTLGLGILAYLGFKYMLESTAILQVTEWSRSVVIASMPVGFTFMTIYTASHTVRALRGAIADDYVIPVSAYAAETEDDAEEAAEAERILRTGRRA